ncbi:Arginine decarboxylase (fragment) [Crenothrix polyspora]|jgi:Domain of unknown function (DUF4266)|uniref:Arginine decarboxylase n=2 Tax=Crenothrix polyspora TaxID=360316 RepID=A0A1R4H8K4_9GAMM
MKMRHHLPVLLLCISCFGILGCTSVQPWERGNLAKPHMALDASVLHSSLSQHNYNSREGAAGGNSAEGGGCGCY